MTKDIKKIFANNIKKLRNQYGITQEGLSFELDFDGSYIGKIENAKMNVTIDKIIKIADYFKIDVYKLFQ